MSKAKALPKFSVGVGDRFAREAEAQLRACMLAAQAGTEVIPVWNKSNREHNIIGSEPAATRHAADQAVQSLHWDRPYYVDADHISLQTVHRFLEPCDFFTIDIADFIGKPADASSVHTFVDKHREFHGELQVPGLLQPLPADRAAVERVAGQFLLAIQEAGKIYRYIAEAKGPQNFVSEVSVDETNHPQTPAELLIILAAIADEGIPIQTIAPKFTGRFNKGVDYAGDLQKFATEFSDDIAVIACAAERYGLPKNLKLSVHSGSDKFSLYAPMREALQRHGAGLHLKTAGTTWLEELIGLAESGEQGLEAAREIYAEAFDHREELCAPYATVIDIDWPRLPAPSAVNAWTAEEYVAALRHVPTSAAYNSSFRQLLHVGFKVAAKMGERYLHLLAEARQSIEKNVTENLYERHIKPLFVGL